MSAACEYCPCPGICLRWPVWCEEWAPGGDPVHLAHIRHRSEHGPAAPAQDSPAVAGTIALTRAMNACPFRSTPPGCCAGGRCALRRGAVVSHLDCFPCIERYS